MTKFRSLFVIALLTACTPNAGPSPFYRDTSVPITSVALFDPAQFAGRWDVVASYGMETCGFDVVATKTGVFDLAERGCSEAIEHSVATMTGPGRYTPKGGARKNAEHWVMWVDQTYRTAVIGTVGGEFGMILNRGRDIPSDRLKAAREILDWNGYDLARLVAGPDGG